MSTTTKRPANRPAKGPAATTAHRKLPLLPIVIGAIVLVAIAVALIAVTGGDADKKNATSDGEAFPVSVSGAALPQYPGPGETDPAVGEPAPVLTGKNFAGETVSIPADDGKAKAIFFVAHWCPHCRNEVPRLAEWLQTHELPAGVEIAFVSTRVQEQGTTENYPPSAWLAENGFADNPTIADEKDANPAYQAYGAGGLPYVVYLDKANNVVLRTTGEYGDDPELYTPIFDALAQGDTVEDPRG